jgi:hypothetical protein
MPMPSRRPFEAEARVRVRVIPYGFCGGQTGNGTGLSTSSSIIPVNIIPPWFSIFIYHLRDEQ